MIEVDGNKVQWSEGMTIATLFEDLDNVEFCSVVRLNGKLVSSPEFESMSIPDNATVQLLPLVAGG